MRVRERESSHHVTFKWEKPRWHLKETAIDISHQPVHETPAENNEPFTGAFECWVLNGETVCEKILQNRFSSKAH